MNVEKAFQISENPDQIIHLSVTDFVADPLQSGRKFPRTAKQIKEQMDSIADQGQLEPVAFRLADTGEELHYFTEKGELAIDPTVMEGGEPVVLSGFGRILYIAKLNESNTQFEGGPDVKAILWNKDALDAFVSGLHSNLKRHDLKPMDLSYDFQRMKEAPFLMKQSAIAAAVGMSNAQVSQMLDLQKVVARGQKLINDGVIPARAGYEDLARMEPEAQEKHIDKLLEKLESGKGKLNQTDVREGTEGKKKKKGKKGEKEYKAARTLAEVRKDFTPFIELEPEKDGEEPEMSFSGSVFAAILNYVNGKMTVKTLAKRIEEMVPTSGRARVKSA